MNFNPELQYRSTIIRGKATKVLDNLLPMYAYIIDEICPCEKSVFAKEFNIKISQVIGEDATEKTLNNHRTEIAGKLFGMYFEDEELIFPSERTLKYLKDADQPAFFKDMCFKFQFPNGMDKIKNVKCKIEAKLSIRQYPFILQVLLIAKDNGITITRNDVAYYILNSHQVLQGIVTPEEVINKIIEERELGIERRVEHPYKESSYSMQHIREQLNYLELANLIRIDGTNINLNISDLDSVKEMAKFWSCKPGFDVYNYDLSLEKDRKLLYHDWQLYYSSTNSYINFNTTLKSLEVKVKDIEKPLGLNNNILGDEGENFVLELEKKRVELFDPKLVKKVVHLGKTKGLGYDIQSVVAEAGDFAEFVKYIEVKSTKRVTVPEIDSSQWIDTINFTRNEWIAAMQHKDSYVIYRVYFTPGHVHVYVIENPFNKNEEGKLKTTPTNYRIDIAENAVDYVLEEKND